MYVCIVCILCKCRLRMHVLFTVRSSVCLPAGLLPALAAFLPAWLPACMYLHIICHSNHSHSNFVRALVFVPSHSEDAVQTEPRLNRAMSHISPKAETHTSYTLSECAAQSERSTMLSSRTCAIGSNKQVSFSGLHLV